MTIYGLLKERTADSYLWLKWMGNPDWSEKMKGEDESTSELLKRHLAYTPADKLFVRHTASFSVIRREWSV